MKKLIIAIDCDDVLVETTKYITDEYNNRFGTNVVYENAYMFDSPDWDADNDTRYHRVHEIIRGEGFAELKPRNDAIEVVNRLSKQHELHLVTARDMSVEFVTIQMLNQYFPDCFTELNHIGETSKGEVCRAIRADVLVDDHMKHLQNAHDCGVGFTIWFGNYPHHAHDKGKTNYDAQCKDWYEVEAEINKLASK